MGIKSDKRKKRALKTRSKIALTGNHRLTIFRSNSHIYAQIINNKGSEVLVSASTSESDLKSSNNGNIEAASRVGKIIARVVIVSFQRSTKSIEIKLIAAKVANLRPLVFQAKKTKIKITIGNGIQLKSLSKLSKVVSIGAANFLKSGR